MVYVLAIVSALLLGLAFFVSRLFGISIFNKKSMSGLPNGSMGLPLIGETLAYLNPHQSTSIGTFLQEHCSRYGKVFKSNLFGIQTIVSCDHEMNAFILQNEGKLFQSSYPKPVRDILGKFSMMLVPGRLHKKLRTVGIGFINSSRTRPHFIHNLEKLSLSFINSWKAKGEVLFFKESKQLTFYLMLKTVLNIESDDPIAAIILEDFLTFMRGFVSLPLYFPGNPYAKAINARTRISNTLNGIIKGRRKIINAQENLTKGFLDELITNVELNDEERVSILLDLLLAGYETTSGLMALIVYFLGQSPYALQTLKEEHMTLRKGKKNGEPLDLEDYKKMEFTSHVINEALRCGNLVKFVHRKALQDVQFKGYLIPKGWQVLPILSAPHLDPCLHQNPMEFNPWRWQDPGTCRKVAPFGGGIRICPGAELGKLENAIFLHHFVLNTRWRAKEEDCPMSCPYLEFKKGLELEIEAIVDQTEI